MRRFKDLFLLGLSLMLCVIAASSCSDNNPIEETSNVADASIPAMIIADFQSTFPDAKSVGWKIDSLYASAAFCMKKESMQNDSLMVWYSISDLKKKMLSSTIEFDNLPDAVKEAFYNSDYGTWTIAEIATVLTRYTTNAEVLIYVVKATGSFDADPKVFEVSLFYTADGVLVKLSLDVVSGGESNDSEKDNHSHGYSDWLLNNIPDYVTAFVGSNYPGASYLHIYAAQGTTSVKILDGHTVRTLLFDAEGNWLSTRTGIHIKDLPEAVRAAIAGSQYADCKLDSAEECITPNDGVYYIITVKDKSGKKIEVRINADGTFDSNDNGDTTVGGGNESGNDDSSADGSFNTRSDVEAFLQQRYPGASITKWDSDDKKLEVELNYNGVKIDVEFERTAQGYVWESSEWDLDYRQESAIPAAIQNAISTLYADYQIYFLTFVETAADGNYYEVGLKSSRNKNNIKVKFDEQGNVLAEYGNH